MTNETETETDVKKKRGRPFGTIKPKKESTQQEKKHTYVTTHNSHIIKEKMLEAIEKCNGIITLAAETINIRRETHYDWLNNDPEYKEKVDNIVKYAFLDYANKQLYKLMEAQNTASIIYAHKYATGYQEANNTFVNVAMPPTLIIKKQED